MNSGKNGPIRIAAITTSRSDFGSLEPVLRGASADCRFDAQLLICGQHIAANTPLPEETAGLTAVRLSDSAGTIDGVPQDALVAALRSHASEVAFLVGDCFELLSVAECCTHAGVGIVHCSGGERTFGAFDDQVRDAITKLAHLHCVAHEGAAERVQSLQEELWRVAVTGDPGLDPIAQELCLTPAELEKKLGVFPTSSDIVVAFHPVTRSPDETRACMRALAEICESYNGRIFLSAPNGDPGSELIRREWTRLASRLPGCIAVSSLGAKVFRSLVAACGALVGNSSAGIWEAPSLGTPSLDIGTRQRGRIRGKTVCHCDVSELTELGGKVEHLLSPELRAICKDKLNPYGDGAATARILDHIARHARDGKLLFKP
jgi:UDP-hydrolysing UDP-N-acetyl-D-glucosamine 2-epimerase